MNVGQVDGFVTLGATRDRVVLAGKTSIDQHVLVSWRSDTAPNGEYDVRLEAAAGDVAKIETPPFRIVVKN